MQFPQLLRATEHCRVLKTRSVEQLTAFHARKNRHYTQLAAGNMDAQLLGVDLVKVQLFRESLSHGALIQAAPGPEFLPFGGIISPTKAYRFCGIECNSGAFIQASGGSWELSSKAGLDFIGCVFNRQYFNEKYHQLFSIELPSSWLENRIPSVDLSKQGFTVELNALLLRLLQYPSIFNYPKTIELLCAELLNCVIKHAEPFAQQKLPPIPARIKAAKRSIDYIYANAAELPDLATLCDLSGVSERSLQQGFNDYLGIPPVQFLRLVRLNAVRRDLIKARGTKVKVSQLALHWGFIEFGRFSRDYKALFNELPSKTLKP